MPANTNQSRVIRLPKEEVVKQSAASIAPVAPHRLIRDIGGLAQPHSTRSEAPARPAASFHAQLKPARGGVLDLRAPAHAKTAVKAKPEPARHVHAYKSALPNAPVVAPAPAQTSTMPAAKHTSISAKAMHQTAKAQLEHVPAPQPTRQKQIARQLEKSAIVPRSQHIQRFASGSPVPKLASKSANTAPAIELPAHIAAQHEHLSRLIEMMKPDTPGGHRQATNPSRASFAVAAVAIAVIGGYTWMHNYPQLALSTAADKAGFSASLPSFVPSSYSLKGGPSYSPGEVTLNFASPSFNTPLKAIQQPTAWDTSSLLDNYVAAKTSSYTSLTGQGLTIYLLDGGQEATWINHGIWYSLDGVTNLSRDQLLKMAYSF